jgi:hypothetical protein
MFVFYGFICVFTFVLLRAVVVKFLFSSFLRKPLSCVCLVLCCYSTCFLKISKKRKWLETNVTKILIF